MMKIFKFGGASVKDAISVRNVEHILEMYSGEQLLVVVSAMGKTTNALEKIVYDCFEKKDYREHLLEFENYQLEIARALMPSVLNNPVVAVVKTLFKNLEQVINASGRYSDFDFLYDAIVPFGELLSTNIIYEYLKYRGKDCCLINAFDWVKTDNYFRSAQVDLQLSAEKLNEIISKNAACRLFITQGFIGSSFEGHSTTLGREGSDYTAALAGSILKAQSVTVWKDVSGLFNADPKRMHDFYKIDCLSYKEAVELAYYGAKVIHPKTIKPLENNNIPLYIKSFLIPEAKGTCIYHENDDVKVPFFIFHDNQILISISVKDFSFIPEESLHHIFGILSQCRVQVRLMQNSAMSFSICIDNDIIRCQKLISLLSEHYSVLYNDGLQLITVRYYQQDDLNEILAGKEILMEQRSRITAQFVVRC